MAIASATSSKTESTPANATPVSNSNPRHNQCTSDRDARSGRGGGESAGDGDGVELMANSLLPAGNMKMRADVKNQVSISPLPTDDSEVGDVTL